MLFLGVLAAARSASSASLVDQLNNVVFYNSGVAHASDRYVYVPMSVSYNEQDNITCTGEIASNL